MSIFLQSIMMLCIGALLHAYGFYLLWWRVFEGRFPVIDLPLGACDVLPQVTVVVAAYNEASIIQQRIENLRRVDYPRELLKIVIASDGSDDATVELAERAALADSQVNVVRFGARRGKVNVLNDVCGKSVGDILVFSDANVDFAPDAIRQLVKPFSNPAVGCVCGKLCFRSASDSGHMNAEGVYWRMETWLKEMEGARGVLLGANGAIYAIRRSLWIDCPRDTLVEDFFIPLRLLMKGWRVYFEPKAVAWEDLPPALKDEFGRRIRIGAGDFQALWRCLPLLHPQFGLASWVFWSHKVLRWIGPFFLLGAFISSAMLTAAGSLLSLVLFVAQAFFYFIAGLGLVLPSGGGAVRRFIGIATHFASMNVALLLGFFRWLSGRQSIAWNRTRR